VNLGAPYANSPHGDVQVIGGRIEHGETAEGRRLDENLQSFAVAAGGDRSGFGFLRLGRVLRSTEDVLPQP
jgi:hypothetical protein